jgi:hypothetical protein
MVAEAQADGRIVDPNAETLVYLSATEKDSLNKPKQFTEITPDAGLWATAITLKDLTLIDLLPTSFGITLGTMMVIFLTTLAGHFLSEKMLKGVGRLPYFAHMTASTLLLRTIILLILCGIGLMVIFEMNGGMLTMIFSGIIGLFSLLAVFKLIGITSKSYHFGFVQGLVAMLPGLLLAGMLSAWLVL